MPIGSGGIAIERQSISTGMANRAAGKRAEKNGTTDGRIISRSEETGTHTQLLAQKGRYYALYMTQHAGFAT